MCLFLLACSPNAFAQDSTGWIAGGTRPDEYTMSGDPTVSHGSDGCGYIGSRVVHAKWFGTWMSYTSSDKFLGKRLRLTAYVRTKNVEGWAGLWLRIDSANMVLLPDNMSNRPLKGSHDWQQCISYWMFLNRART